MVHIKLWHHCVSVSGKTFRRLWKKTRFEHLSNVEERRRSDISIQSSSDVGVMANFNLHLGGYGRNSFWTFLQRRRTTSFWHILNNVVPTLGLWLISNYNVSVHRILGNTFRRLWKKPFWTSLHLQSTTSFWHSGNNVVPTLEFWLISTYNVSAHCILGNTSLKLWK